MQMDPIRRGGVVLSVRLWRAVKLEVEDRTLQPGGSSPRHGDSKMDAG